MGGMTSGLPAGFPGAAASGAEAASSAMLRPEVGPFPTATNMTMPAGTKMPDTATMLGLQQQLMQQFAPRPAPPGMSLPADVALPQQLQARLMSGGGPLPLDLRAFF